jgi:hypothetical protein
MRLTEVAAGAVVHPVRRAALAAVKSGHRDWGEHPMVALLAVPPLPVMRRASAAAFPARLQGRAAARGIQPIAAGAQRPVLLPRQESADRSDRPVVEAAAEMQIREAVAAGRTAAVAAVARSAGRQT